MKEIDAAIEALEHIQRRIGFGTATINFQSATWCQIDAALDGLRSLKEQEQEPVANEVQLNIIRWWPDGFADRMEHVWKDLIGFIPNYKLHDLQRMLAEFGFTMKVYEGAAPAHPAPEAKQEPDTRCKIKLGSQYGLDLNGHWFFLRPADEHAEAALAKHSGIKHTAPVEQQQRPSA